MSAKLIKEYKKLGKRKYRQNEGRLLLEGFYLLEEAVKAGLKLEVVFYTDQFLQMQGAKTLLLEVGHGNIIEVDEKVFKEISHTETPQGVGAIAHLPEKEHNFLKSKDCLFLVIDGLQDPGNMGAIIRAAAAADLSGIFLRPGTVDPFNPKAVRASMGGIFYLPIITEGFDSWLDIVEENNIHLIAAHVHGDTPHYEVNYTLPCGIIIGNESSGVSDTLLARAAIKASIPLSGKIDSLNAAMAASVFIFEAMRQRQV